MILMPLEEIIPEIVKKAELLWSVHWRLYTRKGVTITDFVERLILAWCGDWCAENLGHGLRITNQHLEFDSAADALLFKLRFG